MSYSQVGQDIWVLDKIKKGYFLEIGAYDGIKFSNSLLLEENGWEGLLIEANPIHENSIKKFRKNPYLITAIAGYDGQIGFENSNCTGAKISNKGITVNCSRLDTLFSINNVPRKIDYMSLDIEGYESEALKTFPFMTHICSLITVEHNLYCDGPENKNKINEILTSNGYKLYRDNVCCENAPFEDWYVYGEINDYI